MVQFLPALRGLSTPAAPLVATESKSLTVVPGYASLIDAAPGWHAATGHTRADSWDLERVILEGYERSVWTFRCMELMAGASSRLPFRIGRNLGTDDEEVLDDHPLYRLLNGRANPLETGKALRKRLSAIINASKKGAFIEVTTSRAGTPVRLDLLDPTRVRPILDDEGDSYIKHFEYTRRNGQVREIDPKRIRWVREPHPIDPFSGVTPLEPAGMSVQLDFLARLYNVSFIQNDARPSGVIGVDADGLSDQMLDRVESKFAPGVHRAGEVTVLGTGPGGVSYVDTSTKPRDMAYGEMARNAKIEILTAFGIGESLLGNSSERTYANAEAELWNFWTGPMVPHNDLIAGAFLDDVPQGWEPFLDTSQVEALELPRRRDREEAMKEFHAGLRSVDEYRPLAGLKPVGIPQTRALWLSPAKAPVATRPEDMAALGMEDPDAAPQPGAEPGGEPTGEAAQLVEQAQELGSAAVPGTAAELVAQAREDAAAHTLTEGDAAELLNAALEGKAFDPTADTDEGAEYDAGPEQAAAAELAIATLLSALLARQEGVVVARLESPKTRKGTPFWTPENENDSRGGDGSLPAEKVVNAERWANESAKVLEPVVGKASQDAAGTLYAALAAAGVIATAATTEELTGSAARVAGKSALAALAVAADAVEAFGESLVALIRARSTPPAGGASIGEVVEAVREHYKTAGAKMVAGTALRVAAAAVNGAREDAMQATLTMPGSDEDPVEKVWRTKRDARVRPAHQGVEGAAVPLSESFTVDGVPMPYPGYPGAPTRLWYGCRCWLTYRIRPGARLLIEPGDAS